VKGFLLILGKWLSFLLGLTYAFSKGTSGDFMDIKKILLLTFMLIPLMLHAESFKKEQLAGSWKSEEVDGMVSFITFTANGKFNGHIAKGQKKLTVFEGDWELQNNKILYTYKKPADMYAKTKGKDTDQLVELKEGHFIIKTAYQAQRRYTKVPAAG
jgi:hypothetical protein